MEIVVRADTNVNNHDLKTILTETELQLVTLACQWHAGATTGSSQFSLRAVCLQ